MTALRDDLLAGTRFALAGYRTSEASVPSALERVGAWTESMHEAASAGEEQAAAWVADRVPLNGLVVDVTHTFGEGGEAALHAALELAWVASRAVARAALIPQSAGKIVFVAPHPHRGPHAEAARAGLENLARTLSVEWARHRITAVAICPGQNTVDADLAELVSFLLSEAGGYLTGCRFDLGAVDSGAFIPGS